LILPSLTEFPLQVTGFSRCQSTIQPTFVSNTGNKVSVQPKAHHACFIH
jgi:hypothetical protein